MSFLFGLTKRTDALRGVQRPPFLQGMTLIVAMCLMGMAVVGQEAPTSPAKVSKPDEEGKVRLLESDDFFTNWVHYSADDTIQRPDIWRIMTAAVENSSDKTEKILVCSGKPFGYLRSKEIYQNCQFGVEWRFPKDENGNSGMLVYVDGKDEIWPKSIQVQFHRPTTGGVFPMKDAKCDQPLPGKMLESSGRNWTTCVVTCRDGSIQLQINGHDYGEVKDCDPAKGFIALQSEGAEVHFRNLWIRPLK